MRFNNILCVLCLKEDLQGPLWYRTGLNAENSHATHENSQMSAYGEIRPLIVLCHPATFLMFTPGNQDLGKRRDCV